MIYPHNRLTVERLSAFYRVRSIEESALPSVLQLYQSNPQYFYHMKETATMESVREDFSCRPKGKAPEDKYFLGCWDGDSLAAVMELIDGYPDAKTAYIGLFMVSSDYQGHGVGSGIIDEAVRFFSGAGFSRVKLAFVIGNAQSENFWLKNSFIPTGVTSERSGYCVAAMQRELHDTESGNAQGLS